MSQQNIKLNKFDSLYNKFIFEWSSGKELGDIVTDLKNTESVSTDNKLTGTSLAEPQKQISNDVSMITGDDIKTCFYQEFPKFLIVKCQNKFPLDDNMVIPEEIITDYWNQYGEKFITDLCNITLNLLAEKIYQKFIEIFGVETEYNEDIFNETALKLVNLME